MESRLKKLTNKSKGRKAWNEGTPAATVEVTTSHLSSPISETNPHLKYVSLAVLTVQNALLIISMRYTRIVSGDLYFTTTAVVISESLKMVICLVIIFFQIRSFQKYFAHLYESLIVNWKDTLLMSVPAIVYMIQNNLQYVAVSNLEAAVFQVCA